MPAPAKKAAPPVVKKRSPGRPKGAAPVSRDHLLDAALACFVRRGIAATSLRDVAGEAKVTPALLHYYFGDKAALVEALVAERMLPALQGVRARVFAAGEDIAATVAGFVCGVTEVMQRNPWWPQLWVREVLCEGGALRDLLVMRVAPDLARTIVARFAAAQARGELNPGLDPRLLMTSLVGLTLFPAAGAPIWRSLFAADDLDLDDVRSHAIALLDRGLELKS
ncbi:TetR/AcrR family transcriptional regulator [Luteimonas aquatica]|uniref:TetR/AcrR family transcriptional regulator n=1 Tax=Luteimonas aquatica TaxID=450364 RepID=UPI001F5AEA55|nr:TetR/AcrR family transcriptional regulator [Luteimonas aquatica]